MSYIKADEMTVLDAAIQYYLSREYNPRINCMNPTDAGIAIVNYLNTEIRYNISMASVIPLSLEELRLMEVYIIDALLNDRLDMNGVVNIVCERLQAARDAQKVQNDKTPVMMVR